MISTTSSGCSGRLHSPSSSSSSSSSSSTSSSNKHSASSCDSSSTTVAARRLLLLVIASLLLSSSAAASVPEWLEKSYEHAKHHSSRQVRQNNCHVHRVSAVCYHCASLEPEHFGKIHDDCCHNDPRGFYEGCEYLYIEEPKRDGRETWYY